MNPESPLDVIVLGAGPAGMSAAIECASAGLQVQLVEQLGFGGELMNVPGVIDHEDESRSGLDVASDLITEMTRAGIPSQLATVTEIRYRPDRDRRWIVVTTDGSMCTTQVILSTGSEPRKLSVPGAAALEGRGVSYCAACDGPLFAGISIALVASDRWALKEAMCLTDVAADVHVVVSSEDPEQWGGELAELAGRANANVVWGDAREIVGRDRVEGIIVTADDGLRHIPVSAVFGAVGRVPNATLASEWADVHCDGRVITGPDLRCRTPGLKAIGDVRVGGEKGATTAISDGHEVLSAILEDASAGCLR
jgi:thioredoxin reductase (NADPH)